MKQVNMRELTAEDMGMLFDIASAIGSDEIAALTEDPAIAAAISRLGSGNFREVGAVAAAKAAAIIIRNYRKCEPLLRQLLASVTGKSEAEIAKSGAGTYAAMLRQLVTSQGMKDFFTELLPFAAAETAAAETASPDSAN